MIVQSMMSFR